MLANKPLSSCILPVSSIVESVMGGDHTLDVDMTLPLLESGSSVNNEVSVGIGSTSFTATDLPAPRDAQLRTELASNQSSANSDAPQGSEPPIEPLACDQVGVETKNEFAVVAKEDRLNLIGREELEGVVNEGSVPSSPYSVDLSDSVEMDLDKVAHIADCYVNEVPIDLIERCLGSKSGCEAEISNRIISYERRLGWFKTFPSDPSHSLNLSAIDPGPPSHQSVGLGLDHAKSLAQLKRDPDKLKPNHPSPSSCLKSIPREAKSHSSTSRPPSKLTNQEPRLKPKPKPKPKLANGKKPKERDDPKYLYLKDSMCHLTNSEKEPDFDTLLESTVQSQTDSQSAPTRRDSGLRDRKLIPHGQNGNLNDGPQVPRNIPQATYPPLRPLDRDAKSSVNLTGKELRRPSRPDDLCSAASHSRSPPRPSQPNNSRFMRKSHTSDNAKESGQDVI